MPHIKKLPVARKQEKIHKLLAEISEIQNNCSHEDVTKTHRSDTGNWCTSDDRYWTEFKCNLCLKIWQEEGTK